METFFTDAQRQLQQEFASAALAERIVAATLTDTLSDEQADFIHGRNMFFLATVDEAGFPSCSYKGGDVGFVRVLAPDRLVFPHYDGNGMFLSLGNIEAQAHLGMLFVDFEKPQRIRVRGTARCLREGPICDSYPGAQMVVEVAVTHVWVNCPRYVHPMRLTQTSPYVPDEEGKAPLALWKRVDLLQDVLSTADQHAAASAGLLTIEDYEARIRAGQLV